MKLYLPLTVCSLIFSNCSASHDSIGDAGLTDAPLSDSNTSDTNANDDTDAEVDPCEGMGEQPLESTDPTHAVHFTFHASSPIWVVKNGSNCEPFAIENLDTATTVDTRLGLDIACEGFPQCPGADESVEASGTSSPTINWDAREISDIRSVCIDCREAGGSGIDFYDTPVWTPVVAGHYRATFITTSEQLGEYEPRDDWSCQGQGGDSCANWVLDGTELQMVSVEFDLGDEAEVYVDVNLP